MLGTYWKFGTLGLCIPVIKVNLSIWFTQVSFMTGMNRPRVPTFGKGAESGVILPYSKNTKTCKNIILAT